MDSEKIDTVLKSLRLCDLESSETIQALSSLLFSLVFLAKSIEDVCSRDNAVGDIHLAIHAKTILKSADKDAHKLHTLWGPELSNSMRKERDASVAVVQNDGRDAGARLQASEKVSGTQVLPCPPADSPFSKTPSCDLPMHVVKLAQSLLLDSVGWTTHPHSRKNSGVAHSLPVGFLQKILRGVMKEEKAQLGLSQAKVIKYESLLPEQYRTNVQRDAESSFVLDVGLPDVDIATREERATRAVRSTSRLKLEIQKPDRLKKKEQIALITFWLHVFGLQGTCGVILRRLAREGLTGGGCSSKTCGGPNRCSDKPKPLNNIFMQLDGKRRIVGSGEVDPFSLYLFGQEVGNPDIVVRFSSYSGPRIHSFGDDSDSERSEEDRNMAEHQPFPAVIPKADVSRATVFGECSARH